MTSHKNREETQDDVSQRILRTTGLVTGFGNNIVLDGLSLDVMRGEILGIVGGSGSGKTVLMRTILDLLPKRAGHIEIFDRDLDEMSNDERKSIERRMGIMFQQGALFSSLSVVQNVQFQMRENLGISEQLSRDMAIAKLEMVGLRADDGAKLPSELSGGMTKRVALARALALDPELLFLDEPTSGLDPISAAEFDDLIKSLQHTLGLSVFMITHDLESLYAITDRIAVLADGKVVLTGPLDDMLNSVHPWVKSYFQGKRSGGLVARMQQNKQGH